MEKLTKHWLDGSRVLTSGVVVGGELPTLNSGLLENFSCPRIFVQKYGSGKCHYEEV